MHQIIGAILGRNIQKDKRVNIILHEQTIILMIESRFLTKVYYFLKISCRFD
jgi:hypothetical protein